MQGEEQNSISFPIGDALMSHNPLVGFFFFFLELLYLTTPFCGIHFILFFDFFLNVPQPPLVCGLFYFFWFFVFCDKDLNIIIILLLLKYKQHTIKLNKLQLDYY